MKLQQKLAHHQRTTRIAAAQPGELSFMRYAIALAARDATLYRKGAPTWISENARQWIIGIAGEPFIGSFAWCCEWLGYDREHCAKLLIEWADRTLEELKANGGRPEPTTLPVDERIPPELRSMIQESFFGQIPLFAECRA